MSNNQGGLTYSVDIVLCIDATASMGPVIENVKSKALQLPDDLVNAMAEKDKAVTQLRLRVIAYRDILHDSESSSIVASEFFTLPDDRAGFDRFIGGISAEGGGDEPESGLEALAVAINSAWTADGDRRRHVVVIMTDASAHALEKGVGKVPSAFASEVPSSFDELSDMWTGGQTTRIGVNSRRLVLFTPEMAPWPTIQEHWEQVTMFPSQAGAGLSQIEYDEIIDILVNSV
jgi:hypothetical protein